ncbi:glycosyltransferase family A protein [Botrimarina sp.]|uniref:glycosyltransferase family 2 protein n=1 Tax=Botrimarina sp. TaxID=2795802 RepID=UPI0032EFDC0E
MAAGTPTYSVVVPCYNGAPFLRETLDSVLAQTAPPLEILVIDDGSTDDSAAVAESYGDPVRVIRQPNQGESVARNRGIDEARAEWVAFLDADDLWRPSKLAAQLEVAGGEIACVHCRFDALIDGQIQPVEPRTRSDESSDPIVNMLLHWAVLPSSALVRTAAARSTRFPEWTRDSEDMIFFADLRRRGPFAYVDSPLCVYRRNAGQQTAQADHNLRSVRSLWAWRQRADLQLEPERLERLRDGLARRLARSHDACYWRRDFETARRIRDGLRQLGVDPIAYSQLCKRPLLFGFAHRLWDRVTAGSQLANAGATK